MMSVSPPREDVEHGGPSPDNSEHMDRGDPEAQARELAYEFEVKEQDRWLPIANGWSFCVTHAYSSYDLRVSVFRRCTMIEGRSSSLLALARAKSLVSLSCPRSAPASSSTLSMVTFSAASQSSQCPAIPRNQFHHNVVRSITALYQMLTFVISLQLLGL